MCQIPPPPQALLVAPYFQQVIAAVDEGRPIPPIPSYAYPTLRPLVDTPPIASITAAGKRKAPPARQEVKPDPWHGKKRRTDRTGDISASDDSERSGGHDEEDEEAEDEDEEEEEDEDEDELMSEAADGEVNPYGADRLKSVDDADEGGQMEIDNENDGIYPYPTPSSQPRQPAPRSRGRSVVLITQKPPKANSRSKSKPQKSKRPVVDDNENDHRTSLPITTKGLSPAQIEASWRAQTKNTDVAIINPRQSEVQCDNCVRDRVMCWTANRSTACLNCRFVKKSRCQNTEQAKKKEDNAPDGSQPAATGRRLKQSGSTPKGSQSSTSLKITVPPPAPRQHASTSVAPAVIVPSADVPEVVKRRSRSSSRAKSTRAQAAPQPDVAPPAPQLDIALPAPPPSDAAAGIPDPLVCAPPVQEEPRCRYSHYFSISFTDPMT